MIDKKNKLMGEIKTIDTVYGKVTYDTDSVPNGITVLAGGGSGYLVSKEEFEVIQKIKAHVEQNEKKEFFEVTLQKKPRKE